MATMIGVNGGSFLNAISAPEDGDDVDGPSVQQVAQGAANQDRFLYDTKADLAGAAFTGNISAPVLTGTSSVRSPSIGNNGSPFAIPDPANLTATQPAATADPGANNRLYSTNVAKAWGRVTVNAGVITVDDGYNLGSLNITADEFLVVNFARAMANGVYAVTPSATGGNGYAYSVGIQTGAGFTLAMMDLANIGTNFDLNATGPHIFNFIVMGRQ